MSMPILSRNTLLRFRSASAVLNTVRKRQYNFASRQYVACFGDLPPVDTDKLRKDALKYLDSFDPKLWYDKPIVTHLQGHSLASGDKDAKSITTTDAFQKENGLQILSSPKVVDRVIQHIQTYQAPDKDLRKVVRSIESEILFNESAAMLIGNQAKDFGKQDGVTEIEESHMANTVERRLNDKLFEDETKGMLHIDRSPALVGCVSNFTNFLDLCRKTLRNLELGIPVVVLSRSNTVQHTFRWFMMLQEYMQKHGLDAGMVTYVSCDIEQQRRIMSECNGSPLYFTGARPVAKAIKDILPNTFSSTGGPNTMVATHLTGPVNEAVIMSAAIENSGQCTALRHLVTPNCTDGVLEDIFSRENLQVVDQASDSLRVEGFSAQLKGWAETFGKEVPETHTQHSEKAPVAYRISAYTPKTTESNAHVSTQSLPYGIDEHWRRCFVDVTTTADVETLSSEAFVNDLCRWLVTEQPITLSVNAPDSIEREKGWPLAMRLFEKTAQVVYSIGDTEKSPALSCQARPQEAEVFGEFPPRSVLSTYTKFPVIVPSSTPGYMTTYTHLHLLNEAAKAKEFEACKAVRSLWSCVKNKVDTDSQTHVHGYLAMLSDYIYDATQSGPHKGYGARTALWGLQRPPINGQMTEIRIPTSDVDTCTQALPYILPFYMTNAREQVRVSMTSGDDEGKNFAKELEKACPGLQIVCEAQTDFDMRVQTVNPWNALVIGRDTGTGSLLLNDQYPLVDKFVSVLMPLGHIKSTRSDDTEFLEAFSRSHKWLRAQ
ncbi:hypothetical protein SARC_01238 [Sphaeroforma arctica JP610]|uniref:Aldehyde dehydrogenase domain-containing protein n=1 Tax=Sphaeroforma arctica JP610 TaxID=667725 RepID=A0A0L0GCI3_9EUKA|nr:hypothetical protein SARC_01238 [Sphaeroforma arctica JP610]KNC86609.1 hypothetical protein SARC_01238 [Sphaeroforma arctica JP610]|eukprot:XP_014160511.1 hypothetical protein SARC_01238 [Sphaeroforma arctica JP610]